MIINCFKTSLGKMYFGAEGDFLVLITLELLENQEVCEEGHPVNLLAWKQIKEYLAGQRKEFDLPIKLNGTPFQRLVWETLTTVKYGELASYKDIANRIEHGRCSRAIGGANSKNPIMIVIPCHRVISASGKIGGYSFGMLPKVALLELENSLSQIKR